MRTLEQLKQAAADAKAATGPDTTGEDAVLSSLQTWFHMDSVDTHLEVHVANGGVNIVSACLALQGMHRG